ncbi:MAG: hypothetical protein KDD33_03435 [Bdellovibrionales bacterium]|nr:hypothetical protein [Bdellovibrionales bacterium]
MQWIALFVSFFIFTTTWASDVEVYLSQSMDGPHQIHLYAENDLWIVEDYLIAPDGLPDKQDRVPFAKQVDAKNYIFQTFLVTGTQSFFPEIQTYANFNESNGVLWKVPKGREWTWDWEIKYAEWVEQNLDANYFMDHGIATDCADAAYSARWIFAHIHKLPAANRLASGVMFTNESVRSAWKKLPTHPDWHKDQRFLKALEYLTDHAYTHTLAQDTYPIEIQQDAFLPGTIILNLFGPTGHTQIAHRVYPNDKKKLPVYVISSTVPKTVRPLFESFYSSREQPTQGSGGVLHFRWPTKVKGGFAKLIDSENMPFYSLEQYDPNLMGNEKNFGLFVFKRINAQFDPLLRVKEGLITIQEMLTARKEVVELGYQFCQLNDCSEGTTAYEDWSTPSRDKRILATMFDIQRYVLNLSSIPEVQAYWLSAQSNPIFEYNSQSYPVETMFWFWASHHFNSEPWEPIGVRWGLEPDFFFNSLKKGADELISQRNDKIQSAHCALAGCQFMEDQYFVELTAIEDAYLANLSRDHEGYCQYFSAFACNHLNQRLTNTALMLPGMKNYQDLLSKTPLLNSDPRRNDSRRWGTMPSGMNVLVVPYSIDSKIQLASQTIYRGSRIENGQHQVRYFAEGTANFFGEWSAPSTSDSLIRNHPENMQILYVTGSQIRVITDPIKNVFETIHLDSSLGAILNSFWVGPNRWIVATEKSILVFNDSGSGYHKIHQFDQFNLSFPILWKSENHTLTVADLKAPSIDLSTIPINAANENIEFLTSRGTSLDGTHLLEAASITKNPSRFLMTFNPQQKSLQPHSLNLDSDVSLNVVNNRLGIISNYKQQKTDFLFFKGDGSFTVEKIVQQKGTCVNCYNRDLEYFVLDLGNQIQKLFHHDKSQSSLRHFMTLKSGFSAEGIYGKWLLLNHESGAYILDLLSQELFVAERSNVRFIYGNHDHPVLLRLLHQQNFEISPEVTRILYMEYTIPAHDKLDEYPILTNALGNFYSGPVDGRPVGVPIGNHRRPFTKTSESVFSMLDQPPLIPLKREQNWVTSYYNNQTYIFE